MASGQPVASAEPLGRAAELGEVDRFLCAGGLRALAVTGPAGIGKTAIWRETVARAGSLGHRVLVARPSQAERSFSFSGLADLVGGIDEDVFASLSPVQRQAIDVALLREGPGGSGVDGHAVAAAVLSVLRELAASGPVLLAVDDAQWLDAATSETLMFGLRRAEDLALGVLVSVRVEDQRPVTFEGVVAPESRGELLLGPLSVAALQQIMRQKTGVSLPRPTLVRIATACAGNPFYALEIAHELERVGVPAPAEPLPVPAELQGLVRARLARLPDQTKDALLAAAAMSRPTTRSVDLPALAPAEEAGIIRVDSSGRVHFAHPLLAAAVLDSAPTAARVAAHRRLAQLADDPEERALHLAAATDGPDEAVAGSLDEAARHANERGATTAAWELSRRALALTADLSTGSAARRAIKAAEYCGLACGDPAEVRAALETVLSAAQGDLRAEILIVMAGGEAGQGRNSVAYELLQEALKETSDPRLLARLHSHALWASEADATQGLVHAAAALSLLEEADDPGVYAGVLLMQAYFRLLSGQGADDDAVLRGKAIEDRAVDAGLRDVNPVPVIWPLLRDDFDSAEALHRERLAWARNIGDVPLECSMMYFLAQIEVHRGRYPAAEDWVASLVDLVERSGTSWFVSSARAIQAMVDAHLGRLDAARERGSEALQLVMRGQPHLEIAAREVLGFVALSAGDLEAAVEHLARADEILIAMGQREPAQHRFHPDLVEALIGLGGLAAAETQVDALEARSRDFERPWTLSMAARCRGQLLAAEGELDGAAASLREALGHLEALDMPFEKARTLLVHGQLLRRRKERRGARDALQEALSLFEALGSSVFAAKARAELARIPMRSAREGLSATEEEIARLAATGLTNREIAERAFVSPKTVEGNLARVYMKLGVHSRAGLVRAMAERAGNT